jgi:hypothetical protein
MPSICLSLRKLVSNSAKTDNISRKHFRDAITALNTAPSKGDAVEQRLLRLEKAIFALSAGLIEQRKQIGAGIAVDLTVHLLTNKSLNSMGGRRRR